ncbi:peroxin 26 [Pochonia chlamydosporia 170]|uniref:Peroxin 26 n=1 Tax=Pochonia chlamydosporia 170 TaxID=1380566 RepID=A0A179FXG1_METCM|nr:peroxin 26 [Pochonia chlamydosporia 170]OAQ70324.1 peroxin 26 [Pochonia chlamydosporia 170]
MSSVNGSSFAAGSPTMTASTSDAFGRNILSSSISSLQSSTIASRHTSQISKTYRQASTLFLTRRLPEALTTLTPLITPPGSADDGEPAPVAAASRTTRIKVWSLYLTILNAILEMDPEEGKDAFGNQEWRALCSKVRDGQVWEEVVHNGYHGVEGDVDSDVVINLATLLLAHARDQTLNQRRLETYLATTTAPNLDLAGKFNGSPAPGSRMGSRYRSPAPGTSGANTPRDLNARVKILELYTLHVLLRNNEWEYAREFISVSSVLDDERREAFLQALQSLQEDQQEQERLEREERQRQEEELRREVEEARRQRAENEARERKRLEEERVRREASEVDYGVEQSPSSSTSGNRSRQNRPQPRHNKSSISSRQNGKAVAPATFTARATMVMTRLRSVIEELAVALNSNPALLMRFLVFLVGFLVMLGHKGLRQRIQRILGTSWNKVMATAGMGTKVSYI